VNVATHDRRVGLLLQDPLLFPHMSVAAMWLSAGWPGFRSARPKKVKALRWLREVDAEDLADRRPVSYPAGKRNGWRLRGRWRPNRCVAARRTTAGLDVVAAGHPHGLRTVVARSGCA